MRRLATPEDIDTVFAVYMHEKVVPFLGYDPMPLEDFRPIYQGLLDSGSFFIYEREARVAGFYRATRYPGRVQHVACLGTLAVDPAFHGQGIALAMVSEAIDTLKAAGVKRIELFAESDNAPALRFYEKLGFEREGTLRKFYKRAGEADYIDEYVMALLVD
ncbi:GNAT family N-acetyltransferase [Variovorax sp. J22G73]|uniref:GNAT family N-acetyltransferase n=1 Tax=unclassified Variovorax TaxID=663243 RepID=UPI000D5FC4D1|nr:MULTISPECIES: GNAT family N-acetyltransferase [unclassified Variovorax]MDM0008608.1 GNAT family N-acetyltransferase [Variovorax sp. J22R203]MDM0101115.1 GNAT family N-acetyltransferase [Variovorax sp. J22G73]